MPGLFKRLFGTAGLQNAIDRHVKELCIPKLDEDENRLVALAAIALAAARFDPSMISETFVKGRY